MIDYSRILSIFYTGKAWVLNGESYEGLDWFDPSPKPTKKELESKWEETKSLYKKDECKDKAKSLLANSDWSTLSDVQTQLENYNDFVAYRSQLRELVINPVENPEFPSEPIPKWIFTTKAMGDNNG